MSPIKSRRSRALDSCGDCKTLAPIKTRAPITPCADMRLVQAPPAVQIDDMLQRDFKLQCDIEVWLAQYDLTHDQVDQLVLSQAKPEQPEPAANEVNAFS